MSGAPGAMVFFRYQVAGGFPNWPIGSYSPMVSRPSPFQSPATGFHPTAPYANGATSGAPGLLVFFTYQVAVDGLNTPMVSFRSPSQSPTTGTHPAPP